MPNSSVAHIIRPVLAVCLVLAAGDAEAYIGPGSGISLLQGLWTALVGVMWSVVAVIRLPFKLLIRAFGGQKAALVLVGLGLLGWFIHEYKSEAVPEIVVATPWFTLFTKPVVSQVITPEPSV